MWLLALFHGSARWHRSKMRSAFIGANGPDNDTIQQQCSENHPIFHGLTDVCLHQPEEVNDSTDRTEIDKPM